MDYGLKELRGSGSRRWKEQRRHKKSWLTATALLWGVLTVSCILASGLLISLWLSYGTFNETLARITIPSSTAGRSKEWDFLSQQEDDKALETSLFSGKRNALHKIKQSFDSSQPDDTHILTWSGPERTSNDQAISFSEGRDAISTSEEDLYMSDRSDRESWEHFAFAARETQSDLSGELVQDNKNDSIRPLFASVDYEDPDERKNEGAGGLWDGDRAAMEKSRMEKSRMEKSREAEQVLLQDKKPPKKTCSSVEEMGLAATGNTKKATLRLRRTISSYFAEHGAKRVRQLPAEEFCRRSFVLGRGQQDGFGNNMYKLLTAAGLGVILNRSLIIAEAGATNVDYIGNPNSTLRYPFGNYVSYTDEAFDMREVKRLWAQNNCTGKFERPLILKIDSFAKPAQSSFLCEDWTNWTHPILWFKDTPDTNALQLLLKNQNANFRSAAAVVLGDPSLPDSRPNTFGELMMAVVEPTPEVKGAVDWALSTAGFISDDGKHRPDITLHLRMLHSPSKGALLAAKSCISNIVKQQLPKMNKSAGQTRPRVLVVSDTTSAVAFMKQSGLGRFADVMSFDYKKYLGSSEAHIVKSASLLANTSLPPPTRRRDWGSSPRWVAVVDFFLAARAKYAVVSGAHQRVGTTYAQLVGALAAAYTLKEDEDGDEQQQEPARLYSSFQALLLEKGLSSQSGWGHSWRPFGGKLSCPRQPAQCALTPLLPYAWWDGPLQSPITRDRARVIQWGIQVGSDGEVTEKSIRNFCLNRKRVTPDSFVLHLPKVKTARTLAG